MADAKAQTCASGNLGRWLSRILALLGLALLAAAGYLFWRTEFAPDIAAPDRSELVVDNPHHVVKPPIKGGMERITFTLRNPGARPTRVVGAGEICSETV